MLGNERMPEGFSKISEHFKDLGVFGMGRNFPKRVFEAQVQEDCPLACAGAYPDRHGDSGHNLQAVFEVVGPSEFRGSDTWHATILFCRDPSTCCEAE